MTQDDFYCQCGCGRETNIATRNDKGNGDIKGKHFSFLKGHHSKKEKIFSSHGYIKIKKPEHPRADPNGYVYEHILIMERLLNRAILITESIHHINEEKGDNSPGNLMLFKTNVMHLHYHMRLRAFKAVGHWDWRSCKYCKEYDDPLNMVKHGTGFYHNYCRNLHERTNYIKVSDKVMAA